MSVASQESDRTNYREKPIRIIQRKNNKQEIKKGNRILLKNKDSGIATPDHHFERQCTGR